MYVPVVPDEARRRWLHNRQTHERYDVRDEDFELAVRMFDKPDGESDVLSLEDVEAELGL